MIELHDFKERRTFIELFCGKGIVTSAFKSAGYITWCMDNRKRKGICEPDMKVDIINLRCDDIPIKRPAYLFAAVPCTAFSYGAGNHYYDGRTPKQTASYFLKVLDKTLQIITEIGPGRYFIENPRGKLRYEKLMIDFLAKTGGTIKEISMGSYGFPTIKPTDIFTNAYDWEPRPKLPYGRGNKNPRGTLRDLTLCSKQETPEQLAMDILQYCDKDQDTFKGPGSYKSSAVYVEISTT